MPEGSRGCAPAAAGHLFIYEAHTAAILWTWHEDRPRIREDRSYFGIA